VASVIAQTYIYWELIVVDDGSTDDTAAFISSVNDSRIHFLSLEHTGNIALLRNAGATAGSGEWIAFLDSDDEWVSYKLEIQLQLLIQQKKRWSYGGYELMDEHSHPITAKAGKFHAVSGWIARPLITTEVAVNVGSVMVERNLFNDAGGFDIDPKLVYREDYELALRLALMAEALAVPQLLVRVREHINRSTNAFDDGHERTAFVYSHFIKSRPGHTLGRLARRRMAFHVAEIGVNCIRNRKYLVAVHQFAKAIVQGDNLKHLVSAINRGLSQRFKKIK
jgi:glycosyltransferase involved in cell wall biosynthesis